MRDNCFEVEAEDHVLEFNGLELVGAKFEPEHGSFFDIEFGSDYFISGETDERRARGYFG